MEALGKNPANASFLVSALGLISCAIISAGTVGFTGSAFGGMVTSGGYASLFSALFAVSALVTILLSRDYLISQHMHLGEFYLLVLFATLGMMLMASAADLIIVFLGLELMSICLYVLAGFMRKRSISNESSLKYFLLGAFATGFLLYGIALLYGASGTTNIPSIIEKFPALSGSPLFWGGAAL